MTSVHKIGTTMFGTEAIQLDHFQNELLRLTEAASAESLAGFFDKSYEPFLRFLLHLYICSLTAEHPSRKRKEGDNKEQKMTTSEQAILSQWAHILTLSPPTAFVMHSDGDIDEVPLNQLDDVLKDLEDEELVVMHTKEATTDNTNTPVVPQSRTDTAEGGVSRSSNALATTTTATTTTATTTTTTTTSSSNHDNHNKDKDKDRKHNISSSEASVTFAPGTSSHHRQNVITYYAPRKKSVRQGPVSVKQRVQGFQQPTPLTASALTRFNNQNASKKSPKGGKKNTTAKSPKAERHAVISTNTLTTTSQPNLNATTLKSTTKKIEPPKQVDFDEEITRKIAETPNDEDAQNDKDDKPRHHSSVSSVSSIHSSRERTRARGSVQSFGNLAMLATSIAYARAAPYSQALYVNHSPLTNVIPSKPLPGLTSSKGGEAPSLNIGEEDQTNISSEENKDEDSTTLTRKRTKRDSMWEGLLDINNVIMSPETPKWRSQTPMEQNEMVEDQLLNAFLHVLSINTSKPNNNSPLSLDKEIGEVPTGVFCFYLPLIAVIAVKSNQGVKINGDIVATIRERTKTNPDCKQALEFLLNAYRDCPDVQKTFAKTLTAEERESLKQAASALEITRDMGGRSDTGRSDTTTSTLSSTSSDTSPSPQHLTVVQKEVESATNFFKNVLKNKVKPGTEIKINEKSKIHDPVKENAPPLSRVEIRKIIQSNSKPLLVDLFISSKQEYLSSTVILKQGDDLRVDSAVMQVFRLFNKIWREKGLAYNECPVRAHYYKCVAMAPDFGCIELIPGCKPLRLVGEIDESITVIQAFNLIASAAGSYVASYVMGIRDRHFDNVLIRASDCTLFHIDFGYVLGKSVSIDTSKFAITQDLKRLMGPYWNDFITLGVQAFLCLRERHKDIVSFAKMAFSYLVEPNEVEEFIQSVLQVTDSDADVVKYITRKLKESPDSVRTKFKNVVHDIATRVKRV